jgi:Ca2+-binding RTX toxin-like protein
LRGDAGDDALHGDLDDDTLHGGLGRDTLFGGWGNDVIVGLVDDPATVIFDDLDSGDFLNGGPGNDLILAGQGDLVDTGEGADTVMIGDWIAGGDGAEILDFHSEEDRLIVFYDAQSGTAPNLSLEPGTEDGTAQTLLLNGVAIATIASAPGLTLDHIALLPREALPVIRGL